jgi:hypothetical protein
MISHHTRVTGGIKLAIADGNKVVGSAELEAENGRHEAR